MVVATGTGDGQAQERLGHHVEPVVHPVGLVLANIDRRVDLLAQEPETRAQDRLIGTCFRIEARVLQQVAREMLGDELVVGNVLVQGPDDVIAILPRVRDRRVELVAPGLGVADEVQPVPPPALAEPGRREQPIDQPLVGVR